MTILKPLRQSRNLFWLLALPVLWWMFRSIPVGEIWSSLQQLRLWQILALAAINLVIILLFTCRWWLVLRSMGYRLPFLSLVGYRLAGFGVSYFTPGPQFGGEPLQVRLIRDRHNMPLSTAVGSVSLDKLLELLVNFSFIFVGVMVVLRSRVFRDNLPLPLLFFSIILFSLPAAYLFVIWSGRRPFTWLASLLPSRLDGYPLSNKVKYIVSTSEDQMVNFCRQKPRSLFWIMVLSLFTWLIVIIESWSTLYFLGYHLDVLQIISLLTAARIAFMLPSPGGMGTLEASQVLMMQALGLDPALAISASLLIRGRDLLLSSLGLWIGVMQSRRPVLNPLPSSVGD